MKIAADRVRSLLHADQAETTAIPHSLRIESATVVSDRQLNVLARSGERDRKLKRVAMYDSVPERLLRDSKQTHGDVGGQVSKVACGLEGHLNVMLLLDLVAVRP